MANNDLNSEYGSLLTSGAVAGVAGIKGGKKKKRTRDLGVLFNDDEIMGRQTKKRIKRRKKMYDEYLKY